MSQMLYKCPGIHRLHGIDVDYIIVDESEIEPRLAEGWHLTTGEAKAAFDGDKKPEPVEDDAKPTREEMETKARELGLKFDGRTSDKRLMLMIDAELEP